MNSWIEYPSIMVLCQQCMDFQKTTKSAHEFGIMSNKNGNAPLIQSTRIVKNNKIIDWLKQGFDVNVANHEGPTTPLTLAVKGGGRGTNNGRIKYRANVGAYGKASNTPLILSTKYKRDL